ncbi:MAG: ribosome recycling factor [Chloroflexota bacterium]|nr:ribosome recycling factor [Chloroflexota bacterium]
MMDAMFRDTEQRMSKAISALRSDLLSIRTGRASPALIEDIPVQAYESTLPLNQVATISVPEPRLLMVRPWDVNILPAIERAILKSDVGLTPNNDGTVIRLAIPSLTDERRRELSRLVGQRVEETRVTIRNLRREALRNLEKQEQNGEISEDAFYRAKERLQELTDEYIEKADQLGEQKQAEVMEV